MGILQPSDPLHEEGDKTFCPTVVTVTVGNISISISIFINNRYKLKNGLHVANFAVLTPEQIKYVKLIDPTPTWHFLQHDQEQAAQYVSSLLKTSRGAEENENY